MSDDIMIAYLPADPSWCKQDFPHMTLVWGGVADDQKVGDFNQLAKDAITAARLTGSFSLNVTGVQELGEDSEAVDALIFYPTPQLLLARNMVKQWDAGNFPNYLPHATIGPAGSASAVGSMAPNTPPFEDVSYNSQWPGLPMSLRFNRIAACWGDKRVIFNINNIAG